MDHATNPRNVGDLGDESWEAEQFNPLCGDRVKVFVMWKGQRIEKISHLTDGCAIALGSVSVLSEVLIGMTRSEVLKFSLENLLKLLGTDLTIIRRQCAKVALQAIKNAVAKS